MKQYYAHFITVFFLCLHFITLSAQEIQDAPADPAFIPDSVHVSLLTCSPHPEVYSLYGHTALRIEDRHQRRDWAVNYGIFSFEKPLFALRFVFGLTDYEMGVIPFAGFMEEYRHYGSSVTAQEINLTTEEKIQIIRALQENARPENVVYRYNFFYDNCTTRARDMIVNNINGKVVYESKHPEGLTFRKMIHSMNEEHPWARLGNDLLLGVGADRALSQADVQFLPGFFMADATNAYIVDTKGVKRPLVKNEAELLPAGVQVVEREFPLTPIQCSAGVLVIFVLITAYELRTKRYLWIADTVLFLGLGLCSIILTAMIFSHHPTVSLNTQLLMFNPLILIFGTQAILAHRRRQHHWLWLTMIVLTCLMIVLDQLSVQWIDVSVLILASSLLVRCCAKLNTKKTKLDNKQ